MKYINSFIFLILAFAGVSQINLTNGLVVCLPMDGNANDYSGNNNNGLVTGATPTVNRFGVANSAYHFNGSNNFISIPSSATISSIETNDELTICAWCNPVAWYPAWNVFPILEKYNPVTDWGWAYILQNPVSVGSGNDVLFVSNYPTNSYQTNVSAVLGQWAFYAITYSKASQLMKFYKNGNLIQTLNNNGAQLENTGQGPIYIGYSPAGTNEYSNGDIDDVRLYNRALSDQEIAALYAQPYSCNGALTPVASFSVSKKMVCVGQPVVFTDMSTNAPTSWNWQMTGGTPPSSSVANPTTTFAAAGVYTISLTSGNGAGTSNSSVQTITVSNCVSIEEWKDSSSAIRVYPNPVDKVVFVDCPQSHSILVYNTLGQKIDVMKKAVSQNSFELNFENNTRGVYFLRFFDEEGHSVKTTKLIVKD